LSSAICGPVEFDHRVGFPFLDRRQAVFGPEPADTIQSTELSHQLSRQLGTIRIRCGRDDTLDARVLVLA
jgi:hypothetical protein